MFQTSDMAQLNTIICSEYGETSQGRKRDAPVTMTTKRTNACSKVFYACLKITKRINDWSTHFLTASAP
jgi:hypothetical protein